MSFTYLRRITTRERRTEEGDEGRFSVEYEFLDREEFASRLSRVSSANFIEWNGNFYATDFDDVQQVLRSDHDGLLYEDMPSAVHLKRMLGRQVIVILLFTDDKQELLKLEYARLSETKGKRESLNEWERRLALKYKDALSRLGRPYSELDERSYIDKKFRRATVDLAFMAGKLRAGEDIYVLPNRRDKQEETYRQFCEIVESVKSSNRCPKVFIGYSGSSSGIAAEIKIFLGRMLPTIRIRDWKWDFQIGQILFTELDAASRECDAGIFLITKDDHLTASGRQTSSPRDNIVFEVGFFAARVGMSNISLIVEEGVKVPTDWGGILYIPLRDRNTLESIHLPLLTTMKRLFSV